MPTLAHSLSSPSNLATTMIPSTGSITAVMIKPSMAVIVTLPALCPKNGGKIKFPAPKNSENNMKLIKIICLFSSFISTLLKLKKAHLTMRRACITRGTTQIAYVLSMPLTRLYQALNM